MAKPKARMSHKELANRVYGFYAGQWATAQNWIFYLRSKEFDKEAELRNKLGTVWFCALYDAIEGQQRVMQEMLAEARDSGRPKLLYYTEKADEMCNVLRKMFSEYSLNEQIYISDFRNQMVHTWGANVWNADVHVRYVENEVLVSKKISWTEYTEITRPLYSEGIDVSVSRILARFLRFEHPAIGGIVVALFTPGNLARIQQDIFEGVPANEVFVPRR